MAVRPIGTSDGQYFESPFHAELADYQATASRFGGAVVEPRPTGDVDTLSGGLDTESMGRQEEDWDTYRALEKDPSNEVIPYGTLNRRNKMNIERRLEDPVPLGPPEMRPQDVEQIEDIPGRSIT